MKSIRYILFVLIVIFSGKSEIFAQGGTNKQREKIHSPGKAMLCSIVPGGGQFYNKRYWKIPVIYAGLGGAVYAIDFNSTRYKRFKNVLEDRQSENYDPATDKYQNLSDDSVERLRDAYRNDRDLSIFIGVGIYALNIFDAYIDAHFFEFDVSDDLSLRIQPSIQLNHDMSTANGLALSLKF